MTDSVKSLPLTLMPDAILQMQTQIVDDVTSVETQSLIDQMFVTMKVEHGVGLAATQIGLSLRLAVIDADGQKFTLINPVIIKKSDERITFPEGCLSIPGKEFEIIRHEKIVVRYLDRTGKTCKIKLKGFLAVVFQHEIDHLDGIVIAHRYKEQADLRRDLNL